MQHLNITLDLIKKISEFVEQGMCHRDAFLLAGCNAGTGANWRKQALVDQKEGIKEADSLYIQLSNRMNEAKSCYYQSLVNCVNIAAKKPEHWQAAMTILERRDPEVYSKFTRLKKYDDLGLDPTKQTPLELVAGVLSGVIKGKLSGIEGKQMSEIIGNIIKVEENSKGWDMINQLKAELKKEGK